MNITISMPMYCIISVFINFFLIHYLFKTRELCYTATYAVVLASLSYDDLYVDNFT